MNVNTYDATPALDEVISTKLRVLHDGSNFFPLWFELEPGNFWCGRNRADAEYNQDTFSNMRVDYQTLRSHYGDRLKDITDQY